MSLPEIWTDLDKGINEKQTNTVSDNNSLFYIIHYMKHYCEKNSRNHNQELDRINSMIKEIMYVDVMRDGYCWIFSIILTIREVVLDFMQKISITYRIENIAYDFRLFIAESLDDASVEVLKLVYRRFLMATEDMDNSGCLPDYDSECCGEILKDFYRVKYMDNSYFLLGAILLSNEDWLSSVVIRSRPDFWFLLFFLSEKYKLDIRFLEQEENGSLNEIKIYSNKNPVCSFQQKRFQMNNAFVKTYLSILHKYQGI